MSAESRTPSEPLTPEQQETLERIERELEHVAAVLRILVWSKTGQWT